MLFYSLQVRRESHHQSIVVEIRSQKRSDMQEDKIPPRKSFKSARAAAAHTAVAFPSMRERNTRDTYLGYNTLETSLAELCYGRYR